MIDVVISSAAESDFGDSLSWYAKRSVEAARRFDAQVDMAIRENAADPERFPKCDEKHRYYLLRDFPFQIVYRRNAETLVVMAIAHTSRKPGYWSDR